MEKKNNFISIITLGNFNPAILTATFLKEKCDFESESEPKGQTTPVVSSLDFGNVSFLMELERFQIMEKNPDNFNETKLIKLMIRYLDILRFTPVYVIGMNFNIDIKNASEKVINNMNNIRYLSEILGTDELIYSSKIKFSKEAGINYLSWDLIKKEDAVSRITINLKDNIFTINYNVEVRDIEKNRERIYYFDKNFNTVILQFDKFLGNAFVV